MENPSLFSFFSKASFTEKTVGFSGIRTRIVKKRRVRWPLDHQHVPCIWLLLSSFQHKTIKIEQIKNYNCWAGGLGPILKKWISLVNLCYACFKHSDWFANLIAFNKHNINLRFIFVLCRIDPWSSGYRRIIISNWENVSSNPFTKNLKDKLSN